MGMTIDEAEAIIQFSMQKFYTLGKDYEAIQIAINTMRKYQQIEQIYKEWFTDKGHTSAEAYTRIGEVLKDGNDD